MAHRPPRRSPFDWARFGRPSTKAPRQPPFGGAPDEGGNQEVSSEARIGFTFRSSASLGRSHLGLVEPLGTQSVTQSKLIKGDRTSALSSPLTPEESMPTSGPMAPHLHAVRGNHQWQSSLTLISGNRWQSVAISGSMPQSPARWRLTWRAPLDWTCELARGSRSREMPSCASACRAR